MRLSDVKFLTPSPQMDEPRPDFHKALAGVGDPLRREAADFYTGFAGTPLPVEQEGPYSVGDVVEYTTPEGAQRVGTLVRPYSDESWSVSVDEGLQHIVPQVELRPTEKTPRHARREAARRALARTNNWQLRQQPAPQSNGTTLLTVDVGASRVDETQVTAYAAQHGLQAVDTRRAGNLLRITAVELPQESPTEPDRGEHPGLHREELPESFPVWDNLRAAGYELGSLVDEGDQVTCAFTVPQRYLTKAGRVTATLTPEVAPLSGHFEYDVHADNLRRTVYTAGGDVTDEYASGTGPLSMREDAPRGLEDGDYVVKAADETAEQYYQQYYGPYGEQLTRKIPRREKTAQMVPAKEIVVALMNTASSDPDVKSKLDRAVVSMVSQDPAGILGQIDDKIYPRLLYAALQGDRGRALLRLYRNNVPVSERKGPDYGEPEMFDPEQPLDLKDAKAYLTAKVPEYRQMAPRAQQQLARQLLENPPSDLKKPPKPPGAQVMLPQKRQRAEPQITGWEGRKAAAETPTPAGKHNKQRPLGDQVRPTLDQVSAQGDYLCIRLVWDPDNCTGMSDGNIKNNIVTWVKGLATLKEQYPDLGTLGKPRFKMFDPEGGLATVLVRSSEGRSFPQEFVEVEGRDNTTQA